MAEGTVIVIGGAEDKVRDRVILNRFVSLAGVRAPGDVTMAVALVSSLAGATSTSGVPFSFSSRSFSLPVKALENRLHSDSSPRLNMPTSCARPPGTWQYSPRSGRQRGPRLNLSASNWRINRPREAPIARRTPISRSRAVARASIRLAKLAQAISRTKPAMAPPRSRGLSVVSVVSLQRAAEQPVR